MNRLARAMLGTLTVGGLSWKSNGFAQELGPGPVQLTRAEGGPLSRPGPRDEPGLPFRPGSRGSAVLVRRSRSIRSRSRRERFGLSAAIPRLEERSSS